MRHHWKIRFALVWFMTLLSVTILVAQETCSALIEMALVAVDENCVLLERNNACYGFDMVQAAFLNEVPEDYFVEPADIAGIADITTIATAALDEENGTWGVAILNVQANLPNTLPGQNVTFVLMGDTEVENAVAPEEAFQPVDGMEVTIAARDGANIRSGPGLNFNVVGGARPDTTLQADGQSEDGEWLRVVYRDRVAWVAKLVLTEDAAMNDLPVLTPELRTSMQAFYLRTGIGETACEDAPDDILVVQGPNNVEIELTVNGANIEIGSTIGLRTLEIDDEPFLEMIVFSGRGTANGIEVPVGYRTLMCLGEADSRGMDGEANDLIVNCDPSDPERINDFGEQWCYLEQLPASLLNYPIEILCPGETPLPITNTGGTTSNSQLRGIDCRPLSLVSPLFPVDAGNHIFSWTPANGENIIYELVFYNVDGNQVETFRTSDTSYFINLGQQTATGGEFSWEVRVFNTNGEYACVSQRSPRLMRTAAADPPPIGSGGSGGSGFTAWIDSCLNVGSGELASVSWSGAAPSDTVTVTANGGSVSNSGSGSSGSLSIFGFGGLTGINASTSSGNSVGLGDC